MKEAHEQVKNGNVFKFVKDYWFLILFLFTVAFGWSELRAEVRASSIINDKQDMRIENLDADLRVLDKQYTQDVSVIKTQLQQLLGKQL